MMSNGLLKKFQMCLMNEEGESWAIDVKHEAHSGQFLTIRGWRSFCVANGKKPGDLFEFKLVQNEETPVLQLVPLNSEVLHKLGKLCYLLFFQESKMLKEKSITEQVVPLQNLTMTEGKEIV